MYKAVCHSVKHFQENFHILLNKEVAEMVELALVQVLARAQVQV